jgi:hypothetical protein
MAMKNPLGFLSQPQGAPGQTAGGWQPTVIYLLLFVIAEMIVFGFISRTLR